MIDFNDKRNENRWPIVFESEKHYNGAMVQCYAKPTELWQIVMDNLYKHTIDNGSIVFIALYIVQRRASSGLTN